MAGPVRYRQLPASLCCESTTQVFSAMSHDPDNGPFMVVVVEDESDIANIIAFNLETEGYKVTCVDRGDHGLTIIRREIPDLVILDLMLPGIDGLSVCQQLKSDPMTRDIPIIMVSAKAEDSDVVIGLGLGADDYISKPFSIRELAARAKVALRKSRPARHEVAEGRMVFDELVIDAERHEVTVSGHPASLTVTEFRLLQQFAENPGRALSREQLISQALGKDAAIIDRNIDVHIASLRRKLGKAARLIETIRGIGYKFTPGRRTTPSATP
jgi:two-component system alkaline phosphatase synthesis response regulator PhoP